MSSNFSMILSFSVHNSSLKTSIGMKHYGKLLTILKSYPNVFEGRRSKDNVTLGRNLANLARFYHFRIVILNKCSIAFEGHRSKFTLVLLFFTRFYIV